MKSIVKIMTKNLEFAKVLLFILGALLSVYVVNENNILMLRVLSFGFIALTITMILKDK